MNEKNHSGASREKMMAHLAKKLDEKTMTYFFETLAGKTSIQFMKEPEAVGNEGAASRVKVDGSLTFFTGQNYEHDSRERHARSRALGMVAGFLTEIYDFANPLPEVETNIPIETPFNQNSNF